MLLFVLQPQINQPPDRFRPAGQVLLRSPPVIHILPEALRSHELNALVELFLVAQRPDLRGDRAAL
jgi:hypothetical protein